MIDLSSNDINEMKVDNEQIKCTVNILMLWPVVPIILNGETTTGHNMIRVLRWYFKSCPNKVFKIQYISVMGIVVWFTSKQQISREWCYVWSGCYIRRQSCNKFPLAVF